jgi:hypothetical protein
MVASFGFRIYASRFVRSLGLDSPRMLNRGKQRRLVGVAVLTAAITVLLLWVRPAGPSYDGQSISKWFYQAGNFDSPPDPHKDREAFRAMGSEAVPFLVHRLEDAPSERIKDLLAKVGSTPKEIYRQRKEMWQYRAAYLLGEMGPLAKSAETNLAAAVLSPNWSLRGAATVALLKIRQEPFEPLVEKLQDTSDWRAWYENALMVGQFGSSARPMR